jgi:excisionase family DNA binding protein
MLERVAVRVERNSERVEVSCDWVGGVQTSHKLIRPVRRFEQLRQFDDLLAYIRQLRSEGCAASVVAERLNAAGWRPPKRATFNEPMVQRLLFRYGLSAGRPIWASRVPRQPGAEWTLQEVATRTGIHHRTVYRWLRQGRLCGRILARGTQRIWVIQITEAELDRLKGDRVAPPPQPDLHRNPP